MRIAPMNPVTQVYKKLLAFHGPQGWWPIVDTVEQTGVYHLQAPRNGAEMFEICVGAIMTQSVAWKNAERALARLKEKKALQPDKILRMKPARLAEMIRPAGYYNQKSKKIGSFTEWYRRYGFDHEALQGRDLHELRQELLSVSGIGPETADSILLYALKMKTFVIDSYTKRIFTRLGILSGSESYEGIQALFHRDFIGSTEDFNEYHALIVAHGKDPCAKKPVCSSCCLGDICARNL